MKLKTLLILGLVFATSNIFSQQSFPPDQVITGTFLGKTAALRDFATMGPNNFSDPKTQMEVMNISTTPYQLNTTTTVIPDLQTEQGKIAVLPLQQNFVGASSSESGSFPPDPTGAVGPNHYVHSVNALVKIFDKTGGLLVGPVNLGAFLGSTSFGDPIVLYDQLADRWIVSGFGNLNASNDLLYGVSETSDPTGSYNVYSYTFSSLPDYPHYAVWHDGYYGTINLGGFASLGVVMERDVMLAGGPDPQILMFSLPDIVDNPNQVKSPAAANLLGTTVDTSLPGYITYLQDDAWGGIGFDHLKVWEIAVDWDDINSSTISAPQEIPTDPFDSSELFGDGNGAIRQPGTSQRLAGHGGIISYAANYRPFDDHNSWVITFNTFIDDNETGGIRWIELRNDLATTDWSIFQEGTFAIADGHSRLMSSAAMDAAGNIGMAYTTASETLPVSLRYTGRFNDDPLGQMTVAETVIIDGPGVRNNANRYGDYSHMTMDPDNFTFWFTSDYFSSTNQWRTQIASFQLSGGFGSDVGPIAITTPEDGALTTTEIVSIDIRNFGTDAQTSIPLELRLDGVLVASETYTGSLNPNELQAFTFAQTVDLSAAGQTYMLEVTSNLATDEFSANNILPKEVTHLFVNDIGAIEITAPINGETLGTETISANLRNFGASSETGFDVQYSVNGATPVVETFVGTIDSQEEAIFDFAVPFDFSELGDYTIVVTTLLAGDLDNANDATTLDLENVFCMPSMDCSFGDGFRLVQIAEINNTSGCEGYGDFTAQIANLSQGTTNDITFTTEYGDQNVKVWIDFNDDLDFTNDEIVVPNFVMAPGAAAGSYTETVSLTIPAGAAIGEHLMRAKSNWQAEVDNDPCAESEYGETEDYTVNVGILGTADFAISNGDLVVTTLANKQFQVSLQTQFEGNVFLGVYNVLGQEIGFEKRLPRENGTYKMNLDMSSVSSGVYLLKIGGQTTTSYKTARIIVQ
jgi:hypothetical protein